MTTTTYTYIFTARSGSSQTHVKRSGQSCMLIRVLPPHTPIREYLVQFTDGGRLIVWEDELTPRPIDVPSPRLGQRSRR